MMRLMLQPRQESRAAWYREHSKARIGKHGRFGRQFKRQKWTRADELETGGLFLSRKKAVEDAFWFLAGAAAWVAVSILELGKRREKQSLKGEQRSEASKGERDLAADGD